MTSFDEIRPYHDAEVRPVLNRLLAEKQFLDVMARFQLPGLNRRLPALARRCVQFFLKRQFRHIETVADLQAVIAGYLERVVSATITELSFSGLENLQPERAYLFISNHRDIVFDPALVNYALHRNGFGTVRIAIGDNLLKNELVGEMMRLNKSFIVKRSLTSPREMRDAFLTLSAYISHSIREGESIWIAQQEGRAKDGIDRTDPAIIKMFHMSQKKAGVSFADAMRQLNIVPVSISYEYDPCDLAKARELEERARTGGYQKSDTEDVQSIISGITGFKGRVHVAFGTPLQDEFPSARELAEAVDDQILRNYRLFPPNYLAYEKLRREHPQAGLALVEPPFSEEQLYAEAEPFEQRLSQCPDILRKLLLQMYANPVIDQMQRN